jgi:uncharacterized membrane protein YedE/YeeE
MDDVTRRDWNPYAAGVFLGLVLLASYVLMGFGLGASSAATRLAVAAADVIAPRTIESNAYFSQYFENGSPLGDWMIFETLGVLLGGILGAYSAGRIRLGHVEKGENVDRKKRLWLALLGGIVMGVAARLARGCTSGQALTGGSVYAVGSWIFMLCVFTGGYLAAPFVRRLWR